VIEGYAAVFNTWSDEVPDREHHICFAPGAFCGALSGNMAALWNHDPDYWLGASWRGSLRVEQDDVGLWVRIEPPAKLWVDTLCKYLVDGACGMSLRWTYSKRMRSWEDSPTGVSGWVIQEVRRVLEVTVTPRPLFPATVVTVRDSRSSMNQDWRRQLALEATL